MCLSCGFLFSLIGIYTYSWLFNVPISELSGALGSSGDITLTKVVVFFNSSSIFIVPAILFSLLFYRNPIQYLKLNRINNSQNFGLVVLLLICFLPILNVFVELNKSMVFPEFLSNVEQWMRSREDATLQLTKRLLQMENTSDLLSNVFLIGVIAALGEELIFRGIVQQTINESQPNYHWGIWASAFIFSAVHLQFYGFIPRLLLGALFGYLFHWSRSLWVAIFAHFVNNSVAVFVAYRFRSNGIEEKIEQVGTTETTWPLSILFAMVFFGILYYFRRINRQDSTSSTSYST